MPVRTKRISQTIMQRQSKITYNLVTACRREEGCDSYDPPAIHICLYSTRIYVTYTCICCMRQDSSNRKVPCADHTHRIAAYTRTHIHGTLLSSRVLLTNNNNNNNNSPGPNLAMIPRRIDRMLCYTSLHPRHLACRERREGLLVAQTCK